MRHVSKLTGWTHHAQHRDEGPHCSPREARRIVRHVRVRAGYARVLCSRAKVDGPGGRSNATFCCGPVGKWPVACGLAYPPFVRRLIRRHAAFSIGTVAGRTVGRVIVCVCAPPVDGRVPLLTYTYVRGVLHDEVRAEWPSGRIHCDARLSSGSAGCEALTVPDLGRAWHGCASRDRAPTGRSSGHTVKVRPLHPL
jgi:hypothetical protein